MKILNLTPSCALTCTLKAKHKRGLFQNAVLHMSPYALSRIFLSLNFYDNASMFIDIGIFFYVRHNIFHSSGLSLHFPLKLMSNHD